MVSSKIPNSMNGDANQDGAGWGVTGGRRQGISTASSPQFQRHLNTALPGHSVASAWGSELLSS